MYKVISFLTKKDGLTFSEFRDYYENHHIPLVLSIAATPVLYKRRYIDRNDTLGNASPSIDFDVMTELVFKDESAFKKAWMEPLTRSERSHLIAADEENFLDRKCTRAYTFDEHVSSDGVVAK